MSLRDHFRPPISKKSSWEGFHGMWPGSMVLNLVDQLPPGFVAEPRAHLGAYYEIDVCTLEDDAWEDTPGSSPGESSGGVATLPYAPPAPSMTLETDFPDQYAYEVLVFDLNRDRQLVAAVEIVSPANKDRPDNRQMFIAKCLNLLRKGVCVSIVDVVTIRHVNLYAELLALLSHTDPAFGPEPPPIYAVTCRKRGEGRKARLDTWAFPLAVGQPLPQLPIWLSETQAVALDLEASYEATCRALRIA